MRSNFARTSNFRFYNPLKSVSLYIVLPVAVILGLLIFAVTPGMNNWSIYRWIFFSFICIVILSMGITGGNVRRILLLALVFTIPVNYIFTPLDEDLMVHTGGARAGVVIALYDFPLIGLIVLGLLDKLFNKKPIKFSSIDLAAFMLIIWSAISIYNSNFIRPSFFEMIRIIKLFLLSRVVAGSVNGKSQLQEVIIVLMFVLIFQGLISILQNLYGLELGLWMFKDEEIRRASGTIGEPNTFGAYCSMLFCIAMSLWIFGKGEKARILFGVACVVGLFPVILSFSRGAWVALSAGVTVSLFLGWRAKWIRAASIGKIMIIAFSAITAILLFATPLIKRLTAQTLDTRFQLIEVASNMISAHPFLGIGINNFIDVMQSYDTTGVWYYFPQPVHNVFLLVAAETGLVGFGFFSLLIFLAFKKGLQAVKSGDRFLSLCAISLVSSLVVLVVSNLPDDHLRHEVLYPFFWLVIGLIIAVNKMKISASR